MKNLTTEQAHNRRMWMILLFVLTIVLTALSPFFSILTVGGGYRDFIYYPELLGLNLLLYLLFWPLVLALDLKCLAVTAALVLCGVVIAVELWRRKWYLEETCGLKKSE